MGKFPIPYPWGLEFTLAKISPPRPQAKRIIKKAATSDGVLENAISRGRASCLRVTQISDLRFQDLKQIYILSLYHRELNNLQSMTFIL